MVYAGRAFCWTALAEDSAGWLYWFGESDRGNRQDNIEAAVDYLLAQYMG